MTPAQQLTAQRFTSGTCTLEITAARSPLSQWSQRPILKQVRFQLWLDPTVAPPRLLAAGNQTQLNQLSEDIQTYVQTQLTAPRTAPGTQHQFALLGQPISLGTLALFDLAEVLERYAQTVAVLPVALAEPQTLQPRRSRPARLLWAGSAAAAMVVALSTTAILKQQGSVTGGPAAEVESAAEPAPAADLPADTPNPAPASLPTPSTADAAPSVQSEAAPEVATAPAPSPARPRTAPLTAPPAPQPAESAPAANETSNAPTTAAEAPPPETAQSERPAPAPDAAPDAGTAEAQSPSVLSSRSAARRSPQTLSDYFEQQLAARTITESLIYEVTLGDQGQIAAIAPQNPAAENFSIPVPPTGTIEAPAAQKLRVVITPSREITISIVDPPDE